MFNQVATLLVITRSLESCMVLVARTSAPKLDIRLQMMCNVEAVGLPFKPNTVFWEMGEW